MSASEEMVRNLLDEAGIEVNGDRSWDIQVHDDRLYARISRQGSLGFGEAYMDGWWDVESLDEFSYRIFNIDIREQLYQDWYSLFRAFYAKIFNLQKPSRAYEVGEQHYDIGNDLYRAMLDERMVYTCGYFRDTDDLAEAQRQKLDLICRKLKLEPGMRLLDIGCGWGSLLKFAAEEYGVEGHGLTVSEEQCSLARERCEPLGDQVTFALQDYRKEQGTYDRVASLGMFEHVGYKNYETYMDVVKRCLKPNGLFVLDTIGNNKTVQSNDPWIQKYIFPNSMLPSARQITDATEKRLILEDWHNFGADYDPTLMAWDENFRSSWDELNDSYDERFYRMWRYYLMMCAGAFRARSFQNWQLVLSPGGVSGGYRSER